MDRASCGKVLLGELGTAGQASSGTQDTSSGTHDLAVSSGTLALMVGLCVALAGGLSPVYAEQVLVQVVEVAPQPGGLGRLLNNAFNRAEEEAAEKVAAEEAAKPFDEDEELKPAVKAMEQQYHKTFQGALNSQLHYVRRVCQLSIDQQKQLLDVATLQMKKRLRRYAKYQARMNNGAHMVVPRQGDAEDAQEPSVAMQKVVRRLAEKILTKPQLAKLAKENKSRASELRSAAINSWVVKIDKLLVLSQKQRKQLVQLFDKQIDEKFSVDASSLAQGYAAMPNVPAQAIRALLDEHQKKIWNNDDTRNRLMQQEYVQVADRAVVWGNFAPVVIVDGDKVEGVMIEAVEVEAVEVVEAAVEKANDKVKAAKAEPEEAAKP